MLLEISIQNASYYNGGTSQALKDGYFTEWTPDRIANYKNFKDYYKNNHKKYCIFKNVSEEEYQNILKNL